MLQRVNKKNLRPIIQNHPILSRIIITLIFPIVVLLAVTKIVWENRHELIDELKTSLAIIFLPWNK